MNNKRVKVFNSFFKKLKSKISKYIKYIPGRFVWFPLAPRSASVAGMGLDDAERPYSLRCDVTLEQNQSD